MESGKLTDKNSWIYWFVAADLAFVVSTILLRYIPSESDIYGYGTFKLLLRQMDLGYEMTIGAWWLGLNIFLVSLLSYEIFSRTEGKSSLSWLFFAIVFLGLSVDEVGSIHERVFDSWVVIASIFLVGIIPFIYAIWQLLRRRKSRKAAILIVVGFGVMTSAVPIEYFQHHVEWPSSLLGLRVGFEESVEIFGVLICLIAAVQQRPNLPSSNNWGRVIPNPLLMSGLYAVLIGGFAVHIVSSILTSLFWEIGHWGSPSVFFPSFVFVVIASACFWMYRENSTHKSKIWRYKSYILLATSLFSFYLVIPEATTVQYFIYLEDITAYEKINTLWVIYAIVLSYILYYKKDILNIGAMSALVIFITSFLIAYIVKNQIVFYVTFGTASILISMLVLEECKSIEVEGNVKKVGGNIW